MLKGTDISFSTDGGETWESLGSLSNCTAPEEHSSPRALLGGSFSISGTLEIEVRNYQLETIVRLPVEPYAPKSKPWLKRKKGRAGHGY